VPQLLPIIQPHKQHRQVRDADGGEFVGIVGDGFFGGLPEAFGFRHRFDGDERRRLAQVAGEEIAVGLVVHQLQVIVDVFAGGLAVVAVDEFADELAVVLLRIPHQLRQHPRAHLGHLVTVPGVGAFAEETFDVVRVENARVVAHHEIIRVRINVMAEVGGVIPDVKVLANLRPRLQVGEEIGVRLIGERLAEITFDAAQPHAHVLARVNILRRVPRVLIREGVHEHVGEFRLDLFGDVIDEIDHRAGVAAFGVVDGFAIRALTKTEAIVLRHGNDFRAGRFAQPLLHLLGHVFAQLRIRQAKLGVVVRALAFDQAEPFRMRREIFLGRDQRVKGVAKAFVINAAAEVLGDDPAFVIGAIVRAPMRFETGIPIRPAIFEGGLFADVEIGELERRALGQVRGPGRPPTHAALFLEETVDGIHGAARPAAGEEQFVAAGFDDELFLDRISRGSTSGKYFAASTARADDDSAVVVEPPDQSGRHDVRCL
jgi:hypothetical protein